MARSPPLGFCYINYNMGLSKPNFLQGGGRRKLTGEILSNKRKGQDRRREGVGEEKKVLFPERCELKWTMCLQCWKLFRKIEVIQRNHA